MVEEIEKFEELLNNKCIGEAGDWIKYTHNVLYYCSETPRNRHELNELANRKKYRELVIKEFHNLANKLNFRFDIEITNGEISHIKWYHGDKWIRPINGFIQPIFPDKNLKPKRSPISPALRHETFLRDGYRCVECGATNKDDKLEADHIISVAQGGNDELDNLQTLCRVCNLAKSHRVWKGPG